MEPSTPGDVLRRIREDLFPSRAAMVRELSRYAPFSPAVLADMEKGKTLGTMHHRKALTDWGRRRGLVRPTESWWEACYRVLAEEHIAHAVGRAVGAGLTVCQNCGMPLEIPLPPAPKPYTQHAPHILDKETT